MKRVLLTVAVALLVPGLLMAGVPTIGVYFNGSTAYSPSGMGTFFNADLYLIQDTQSVTAVEFMLEVDPDVFVGMAIFPSNLSAALGDLATGIALTYWPPLTGYPTGSDLLATVPLSLLSSCGTGPKSLRVVAHPDTGELRGTSLPNNDPFPIIGLTSWLCPDTNDNEDASWGAIKSLVK